MPNVMAALPNIGGASVQCCKVWLTPTTRVPCSNAAKTRNPLKLAGVPQLVSWSLTSLFSTNMAISETKGQGWKVIRTQ